MLLGSVRYATPQTIIEKIYEWTRLKCRIQTSPERVVYFKEREIWWASIGANIGSEENGKNKLFERPVLILKKFYGGEVAWVVPATSKPRGGGYYFYSPSGEDPQTFILSQLRTISLKRLLRKQRSMPVEEFDLLREKIKNLL